MHRKFINKIIVAGAVCLTLALALPVQAKPQTDSISLSENSTATAGTISGNSLTESAKTAADKVGQIVKDKAPAVTEKTKEIGSKAATKVKEKAPAVKAKVKEIGEIVSEKANEVIEDAGLEGPNRYESSQKKFRQWFDDMTGAN